MSDPDFEVIEKKKMRTVTIVPGIVMAMNNPSKGLGLFVLDDQTPDSTLVQPLGTPDAVMAFVMATITAAMSIYPNDEMTVAIEKAFTEHKRGQEPTDRAPEDRPN